MGCSSSHPVGDDTQAAPAPPAAQLAVSHDKNDSGKHHQHPAPLDFPRQTTLASKTAADGDNQTPVLGGDATRRFIKPSASHNECHESFNEAPKPSHEGFVRKRASSLSIVARERSTDSGSRVVRVADDEETPVPAREAGATEDPLQTMPSPKVRTVSLSLAALERNSRLGLNSDGTPREPDADSTAPIAVHSPLSPQSHLGLSSPGTRTRGFNGKKTDVSLAQLVLQKQAVAAIEQQSQAPGSPLSNHSLRRPSISKHEGSPRLLVRARSNSVSLEPFVVNQPNNPITAHNVQNLFDRGSATPQSHTRKLSISGLSGDAALTAGSSPSMPYRPDLLRPPSALHSGSRPDLLRPASALRDKWAARTEELWTHYAGRGATHMPKKALMQLSEDLFSEFVSKYKAKLRAEWTKAHPTKDAAKDYTEIACDKDLRNDLPFLLPAKASSSDKPEPDDYVYYIYRFTTREMRRFAAAAPGGTVSAVDNGVGSIKAATHSRRPSISERRPSIVERRPSVSEKRPNMFNLDAPAGPAHSSSGAGLSSERPAAHKLSKAEFTLGWGHCHDMLFKCMEPERERPGTPCKLM